MSDIASEFFHHMVECIIALFFNFYLAINSKKVFFSVMGEIVNMPVIDLGNYRIIRKDCFQVKSNLLTVNNLFFHIKLQFLIKSK